MMQPFFEKDVFPPDVKQAITKYLNNPAASSCSDLNLYRSLRQYDAPKESMLTVEKLPTKAVLRSKTAAFSAKANNCVSGLNVWK